MRNVHCKPGSLFVFAFCAFGVLLGGCGPKQVPTAPVHGKVTWQGKPLSEGTVGFIPIKLAEGLPSRPAAAVLKPDGTYEVSSFRAGDGLVPGEYGVTVRSFKSRPTESEPDRPFVWRIPERYGDIKRSGLQLTVSSDGKQSSTFDIDIQP